MLWSFVACWPDTVAKWDLLLSSAWELNQAEVYAEAFESAAKSFAGSVAKTFNILLIMKEGV